MRVQLLTVISIDQDAYLIGEHGVHAVLIVRHVQPQDLMGREHCEPAGSWGRAEAESA